MKFKVLSIDAWSDGQNCIECGSHKIIECLEPNAVKCNHCDHIFDDNLGISWTWNNWFNAGEYDEAISGPLNENNAMKYFVKNGYEQDFDIQDDQYNLVLIKKDNQRPVMAIEYGSEQ